MILSSIIKRGILYFTVYISTISCITEDKKVKTIKGDIEVSLSYDEKASIIRVEMKNLSQEEYIFIPYLQPEYSKIKKIERSTSYNELIDVDDCHKFSINKKRDIRTENSWWKMVNEKYDSLIKVFYPENIVRHQKIVCLIGANSEEKLIYKITRDKNCKEKIKVRIYLLNIINGYKTSKITRQKTLYNQLIKVDFGKCRVYEDKFIGKDSIEIIY